MPGQLFTDSQIIDGYVAALRRALRGPVRARRDLVAEARDSLCDAAEAYELDGLGRAAAERRAVEEFGPIAEIAPGYQEELAACQGRRLAVLLFVSVPLTAILWSAVWKAFPMTPVIDAVKPPWFGLIARAVDYLQLATGVVGAAALLTYRKARPPRWLARALGLLVWIEIPLMGVLCGLLMSAAQGPAGFTGYLPGMTLSAASMLLWVWQLLSASRCLAWTAEHAADDVGEGLPGGAGGRQGTVA
ncbi:hypothetical protein J5X84_35360 [Streptosporangiaceae bacterium NEAU-GS5]|nr:hypothetical protein [Streptosporangiaceae bacterium NEAU-GS5]